MLGRRPAGICTLKGQTVLDSNPLAEVASIDHREASADQIFSPRELFDLLIEQSQLPLYTLQVLTPV